MTDTLYLAWAYLRFHAGKSAVLTLAVALILAVPLAVHLLLGASEQRLVARAADTPLLIGARGSTLDLVMNSLYFTADRPAPTTMAAAEEVWAGGLAEAIPLYVRFQALGRPIVGTTLDYFGLRGLEIAEGRAFAVLGEAVLGAEAARSLGLGPGDAVISSPENLFDIGGAYPLKMTVAGVLARTGTPDDRVILVDLKTAWVIEGIGHGHDDPAAVAGEGMVLEQTEANVVAGAALPTFTEITAANIDSFHFHGDPADYPISAVIAVPRDFRSGVILRGRYLGQDEPLQILVPGEVVERLLASVMRIASLLDAVVLVVGLAAALAVALAVFLSLQLRRGEIETIFKLGCRRATIARIVAVEAVLVLGAGLLLAALATLALHAVMDDAAIWLLAPRD